MFCQGNFTANNLFAVFRQSKRAFAGNRIACYETMKEAVNYARRGNSSVLIEALTYRCKGYAEHDNQSYVPSGEIDFWAEHNDPITRYEKFLNDEKILNQEEMKKIVAEVSEYLEAEAAIADEGEMPEPISAAYEVFDNLVVSPAFKKKVLER